MPTETGTAFLVDPMGEAPEQLSLDEYQTIRSILDIVRDENLEAASDIMRWTITSIKDLKHSSPDALLLSILWHYANEKVDADGALLGHHQSDQVQWLSERERKTLGEALICLRAGGWFAGWLGSQVETIAHGKNHAERFPTPLQIAATLNLGWMKTYEEEMELAREMVRMRPDLLCPAPAEPPATLEPQAVEQAVQPAIKKPGTAQRARKTRKKAGHA